LIGNFENLNSVCSILIMIEKKQILEKSTQLFKNFGIRCSTMDDIARELGVSKKTLYLYISDKDALINEIIDQEYLKIKTSLEKIKGESIDCIEELIRINAFIVHFLKAINPTSINDLRKIYPVVYGNAQVRFRNLISQTILERIREGKILKVFRDDINEDLIAKLHTERIDQMKETSGFWGSNAGSSEVIKEMITYYLRGLVTKQGEVLLDKYILDFNKYTLV